MSKTISYQKTVVTTLDAFLALHSSEDQGSETTLHNPAAAYHLCGSACDEESLDVPAALAALAFALASSVAFASGSSCPVVAPSVSSDVASSSYSWVLCIRQLAGDIDERVSARETRSFDKPCSCLGSSAHRSHRGATAASCEYNSCSHSCSFCSYLHEQATPCESGPSAADLAHHVQDAVDGSDHRGHNTRVDTLVDFPGGQVFQGHLVLQAEAQKEVARSASRLHQQPARCSDPWHRRLDDDAAPC